MKMKNLQRLKLSLIILVVTYIIFSMIGCSETHYLPVTPHIDDQIIIDQPQNVIHIPGHQPTPIRETPKPNPPLDRYVPTYNPFASAIETMDKAVNGLTNDLIQIVAMDGGLEILNIAMDPMKPEKKLTTILELPPSIAKRMFIEASVNQLDTVLKLTDILISFSKGKLIDAVLATKVPSR